MSFLHKFNEDTDAAAALMSQEERCDYVNRQIVRAINLFVEGVLVFYQMEDLIKNQNDLKRELVFNLVTNLTLQGDLYNFVYMLHISMQESKIATLGKIMRNRAFLEREIGLRHLNIAEQFQFDAELRASYAKTSEAESDSGQQPYTASIKHLV